MQVSVSKVCEICREMDGNEPITEKNVIVSFQVMDKWHQTLWWLKIDKVGVLLRSLKHADAPDFFGIVRDGFVRAIADAVDFEEGGAGADGVTTEEGQGKLA